MLPRQRWQQCTAAAGATASFASIVLVVLDGCDDVDPSSKVLMRLRRECAKWKEWPGKHIGVIKQNGLINGMTMIIHGRNDKNCCHHLLADRPRHHDTAGTDNGNEKVAVLVLAPEPEGPELPPCCTPPAAAKKHPGTHH